MKNLSQKRSQFALEQLLNHRNVVNKEYKSFVAGVPAMIIQNGFGQTMAFILSKVQREQKHRLTFSLIRNWLREAGMIPAEVTDDVKFMQHLSEIDQKTYMLLQREAMAFLEWVKRYAAALAPDND